MVRVKLFFHLRPMICRHKKTSVGKSPLVLIVGCIVVLLGNCCFVYRCFSISDQFLQSVLIFTPSNFSRSYLTTSSAIHLLVFKIIGLGRFSSCMKWNSGVNFSIHCSYSSCIFLELVVIVTFPLSVLQMRFTITSSCWYNAHNLFAYFTTGTSFCKSKLAGLGILIPYGIFGGIGCLSPTAVLALITYIIFL